ncbi:type II toxin-antitoxin system VapB family antitoxin [Algoriphagus marinus]|uniref:type II toxin-antitoxin system VapB family antitoxin n=1 Tax=Algoriphagus marinus TaxID=1925762 RepID=UPI00094B918B|nr:type II toxin-antitoxin system VapB family antitoxin [Algoriphagus marinus]
MKVTALIEDELIKEVMELSGSKNITEALKMALNEYRTRKKMRNLSEEIAAEPLEFYYGASELRELNQK